MGLFHHPSTLTSQRMSDHNAQQKKNLRSALDQGEVKGSIRIHLTNVDGEDVFSDTVTVNFEIIQAVASASTHSEELHTRIAAIVRDAKNEEEAEEAAQGQQMSSAPDA